MIWLLFFFWFLKALVYTEWDCQFVSTEVTCDGNVILYSHILVALTHLKEIINFPVLSWFLIDTELSFAYFSF